MKMVMQTLDIFDTIKITKNDSNKIEIKSNVEITDNIENNLVYKACVAVLKESDLLDKVGLEVYIEKNIPMGAGMAGGSADCATTIVALNELLDINLDTNRMIDIGKKLGSDVPYCIVGGTKLVEGVGDIITDLNNHPETHVLVAKPLVSVNTKETFQSLKLNEIKVKPNFEAMIDAINNGNVKEIAENFCNVFEVVTIPKHPEIGEIKNVINNNGAINSLMTGTGSTVFGYFENLDTARIAAKELEKSFNLELLVVTKIKCNN